MANLPLQKIDFRLDDFTITLHYDERTKDGIECYSRGLTAYVKMFDSTNKYAPHTTEVDL